MEELVEPSEDELDLWFAVHGIRRAEIRSRIAPYAHLSWVARFPKYASYLRHELVAYREVIRNAMNRYGGKQACQDPATLILALSEAGSVFAARHAEDLLDEDLLIRLSFRLAMARGEAYSPTREPYRLLPLDDDAYEIRAPLPERGYHMSNAATRAQFSVRASHEESESKSESEPDEEVEVVQEDVMASRVMRSRGRGRPRGRPRGRGMTRVVSFSLGGSEVPRVTRGRASGPRGRASDAPVVVGVPVVAVVLVLVILSGDSRLVAQNYVNCCQSHRPCCTSLYFCALLCQYICCLVV